MKQGMPTAQNHIPVHDAIINQYKPFNKTNQNLKHTLKTQIRLSLIIHK
jgi:hypothetical protein